MPIKVSCSCGQSFAAKDEMAGKTVKCPKCKQPLTIPRAGSAGRPSAPRGQGASAGAAQQAARANPQPTPRVQPAGGDLGDLFDEIGIAAAAPDAGPPCPSCGKALKRGAVLCVECGFNLQTGQRLASMAAAAPPSGHGDPLAGQAEALVAKAAEEIAKTPISAEGEDFGEGSNPLAWLLAISLPLVFALAVLGVVQWGSGLYVFGNFLVIGIWSGNPFLVTFALLSLMCLIVTMVSWFKITWTAMDENVFLGLLCIVVLFIFPAIYGFIRYKKLLFWAIAYVVSALLLVSFFTLVVIAVLALIAAQGGQAG